MVSTNKVNETGKGNESTILKEKNQAPPHISTPQKSLISTENPEDQYTNVHSSLSKRLSFLRFSKLHSHSARFQRIMDERDDFSRAVPSSSTHHIRGHLKKLFSRKMDWDSVSKVSKEWIRNPVNLAMFIWIVIVTVSGAILFMVMTGMLNHVIPKKSQRDTWFEVNNQILNALFTLMCLYQHPKRIYHFTLLARWRPGHIMKLRETYCKNGTYKPNEWAHMMVIVILLNTNCFAQYASCALNLGYRRVNRPFLGVGICISIAIVALAVAGVYYILSPLGNDYGSETDEEAQLNKNDLMRKSCPKTFSYVLKEKEVMVEPLPQWSGGVFAIWDDISLAYLSLFCTFCVFGWNMERLGFGNMYVHIATFVLFCLAPFWIFNLAAVNIDNEVVREAMGLIGIFLCVFGLLYGGFWRVQMRKRFNLPPYDFCYNKPDFADCALWVFCCCCSLAQEVRTGNLYEMSDNRFFENKDQQSPISPLPREDQLRANSPGPSQFPQENCLGKQISLIDEERFNSKDDRMRPPDISIIRRETI